MIELVSVIISSSLFKWTAVCIIGVIAVYRYLFPKCDYWESQGVPTASISLSSRFKIPLQKREQDLVNKYGKIFGIYEMTRPVLFVSDPDILKDILVKDFHIFPNRRDFSTGGDPVFDNIISILRDDKWKRVRSIISPAFSTGKLRKMRPLIEECLNTLIKNLDNVSQTGEESDMKRIFGAYSMEVVIQVAFGTKVDALFDETNPILINARKIFNRNISPKAVLTLLAPKIAKLFKITLVDISVSQFFRDFTMKIVDQRKKSGSHNKRVDFLQLLLNAIENNDSDNLDDDESDKNVYDKDDDKYSEYKTVPQNKTLTNDEFVAQCVIFLLAGYDTTATTLSFAIYNLACNPEAQQKLYEEAKSILGSNKEVDYDVVHSLKYLDSVVMESLRLYPPALFLERVASEDYVIGTTGIKVKKGQLVHIPTYSIHRDSENFPEPDSFKPERFFPENRIHHPYAHLPFGAGPRSCVGMRLALLEAKLALLHSVYRFKFSTGPKTVHPPECYVGGLFVPKEVIIKVERR